jgi:2-polyprenyl-3-methyl-5-hydroxy-6-metoxy-1,4-benzoquinol methylase
MKLDWGTGDYSATGRQLEPASVHVVDVAAITEKDRVLDVGCGTGNAALEAARRGASVSGIDPASQLVSKARRRAETLGLAASFAIGEEIGRASISVRNPMLAVSGWSFGTHSEKF